MKYDEELGIQIPKHWEVVRIEEIGQVIGGGTPSTKQKDYYGGNIPWITPKDLSGYSNKYILKGERNITELGLKKSSAKLIPKNTVLLSSRAPIGYVAISANELCTNQGFKSVICDESKIYPEFLYYIFKISKRRLESVASGTTFKEISGKKVKEFKIPLPPLNEQLEIINILNYLDSKIELNNSIISNLEELAQTLFKHWFVDFEFPNEEGKPYRSSGGKMVESELGMIPEGWSVGTLNDVGEIVGGGTPSKKIPEYYSTSGISWLTPKDLSVNRAVFQYKGANDISELGLNKSSARLLPENTVLFSSRAPIGYIAIAGQELATNQGFKSVIPSEKYSSEYVYFLLENLTPVIEASAGGSTFKEISATGMKQVKTILPLHIIVKQYGRIVNSIFDGIKRAENENLSLENLRDTLLSKLLSGEIDLKDVEIK